MKQYTPKEKAVNTLADFVDKKYAIKHIKSNIIKFTQLIALIRKEDDISKDAKGNYIGLLSTLLDDYSNTLLELENL